MAVGETLHFGMLYEEFLGRVEKLRDSVDLFPSSPELHVVFNPVAGTLWVAVRRCERQSANDFHSHTKTSMNAFDP